jgi:hypothetical protein
MRTLDQSAFDELAEDIDLVKKCKMQRDRKRLRGKRADDY